MSQTVQTQFGTGTVVDRESIRGRVSYKVEGPGFSTWVEATAMPLDFQWMPGPDDIQDNSVTLPYNPAPQSWTNPAEQNIQPGQNIDPRKRTAPADSVDFQEDGESYEPGPDPRLFASNWERTRGEPSVALERVFPDGRVGRITRSGMAYSYELEINNSVLKVALGETYETASQAKEACEEAWEFHNIHNPRESGLSPEDIQAKLGPKYVNAFVEHDFTSLQARLEEHPEIVFSEVRERVGELVAQADQEHLERVGRNERLEASDPQLREAAWKDVRAKAVRLRKSGQINLRGATPDVIAAQVTGDHGTYEVMVMRSNIFQGNSAVDSWTCECPWGQWAWKREHSFVGRMCSHAYASLMELQSLSKSKNPNPKFRNHPAVWASRTAMGDSDYVDAIVEFVLFCNKEGLSQEDHDSLDDYNGYDEISQDEYNTIYDFISGDLEEYIYTKVNERVRQRSGSRSDRVRHTAAYDDVQPVIEMIADMGYAVGYDLHFSSMSNKWVMESKMLPEPLRGTTKATFGKNPWAGGGYSLSWTGENLQFDSVEELQEAVRSLLSGKLASRTAEAVDIGSKIFHRDYADIYGTVVEDDGDAYLVDGDGGDYWIDHEDARLASRTVESMDVETAADYARDNVYDTLAENGLDIHDPEAHDLIQETWRSSLSMYEDMYGLEIPEEVYNRYASRTAADTNLDDLQVLRFLYQFENEGLDTSASGEEQWEWVKSNVDYDTLQDAIDSAYEYGEMGASQVDALAYDLQQNFFGSRTAEIVDLRPVGWDPYSRSLMNKLRTLTDEGSRPGRQKERNDEIRELVTELRERGFDTNGIIASHEAFMDRPYGYGDIPDYGTTLDYILDHEVQKREDVEEPEFEYPAGGEHGVVNDINDGGGERTAALSLPKGTQVQRLNLDGSLSGQTGVVSRDHQGLTEWDQVTVLWDGDSQPSLNDFSEIQWGEYEDGTPTKRLDDPWNIHGANDDYFYGEPPAYDSGDEYGGGEDPFYVDPMEREDFPEDDIVANFQRNAGWLMGNDGGSSGGNDDIAAAAEAHLRTAGRHFTMAEQQALIDEDDGKPYDRSGLRLDGTHYL